MVPPRSVADRITELESALAHYQRDYDHLNQAVIDQSLQIDKLSRRLRKLEAENEELRDRFPERERDLSDDKPPHY